MRVVLYGLLSVVACAAAVLSFSALRDLALVCGFAPSLAWLLPVVIDAGAAAGSVTWLSQPPGPARWFGRRLAVVLLGASVGGNAIGHVLEAYRLEATWWLVVAVSGLAPAVLASVVHLVVLAVQDTTGRPEPDEDELPEGHPPSGAPDVDLGFPAIPEDRFPGSESVADGTNWSQDPERRTDGPVVPVTPTGVTAPALGSSPVQVGQVVAADELGPVEQSTEPDVGQSPTGDRAAELLATGAGRVVLARELGVSSAEARRLAASRRNGHRRQS